MASELENASLKVVLDLEEARQAVDEIEREQERRHGTRTAPPAIPEGQVDRPDAGVSAATGVREVPVPAPAGDAMDVHASLGPAGGASAAESTAAARAAIATAQRVGSFVAAPTVSGASALAGELTASGAAAGAEAAGLGGAAGPIGLAVVAAFAAAQQVASKGPGFQGFVRGVAGQRGVDALNTALFGVAGATGVVTIDKVREAWDTVAAKYDALQTTVDDLSEIAFASMAAGGRVNSGAVRKLAGPMYRAHDQYGFEQRQREAIASGLRGEAGAKLIEGSLSDFLRGNR